MEKDYTIKVADGKFTLQMNSLGPDGKLHSMCVPYPLRNGKTKLTRKQTENYCLQRLRESGFLAD